MVDAPTMLPEIALEEAIFRSLKHDPAVAFRCLYNFHILHVYDYTLIPEVWHTDAL